MMAPTLHTERLTLRPAQMADFPAYAAFVTSDRARFMGGPHDAKTAWHWFCNDTAQWALLDMGALMITMTGDDGAVGQVAVCHGPIFPEPELGWFLFDGYEGQGIATEAAAAMRDWAFGARALPTIVSYIDPENLPSIRVAQRLGAVVDPLAATPGNEPTLAYRLRRAS
jgi:RimJ/RimL family protein N-acetyltransferase